MHFHWLNLFVYAIFKPFSPWQHLTLWISSMLRRKWVKMNITIKEKKWFLLVNNIKKYIEKVCDWYSMCATVWHCTGFDLVSLVTYCTHEVHGWMWPCLSIFVKVVKNLYGEYVSVYEEKWSQSRCCHCCWVLTIGQVDRGHHPDDLTGERFVWSPRPGVPLMINGTFHTRSMLPLMVQNTHSSFPGKSNRSEVLLFYVGFKWPRSDWGI